MILSAVSFWISIVHFEISISIFVSYCVSVIAPLKYNSSDLAIDSNIPNMLSAELQDLSLGQGEWRNMQQIIRKTFKLCLEKQQEQSQQISHLSTQVLKLKEELTQRPTWADVENMIMLKTTHDKHIASFRSKQSSAGVGGNYTANNSSSNSEIEELKLQVSQLKSECERRATIQSMQTALNRKADRVDLQNLRESTSKVVDTPQDLSRLKLDIAEVKSEIENLNEKLLETNRSLGAKNTIVDLSVVKVQLEGLFRRVHEEMYNREEINSLLNQKISRVDADKLLVSKVDGQVLSTVTTKIEDTLAEHERLITALRLSVSDPSLFSADFLSKRGPILPRKDDIPHSGSSANEMSPRSTHRKSSSSTSSMTAQARTGLQDSKLESIISGLWNKMNALIKEYKGIKEEHSTMRQEMAQMKGKMDKVAAVEKMELLAVVVEEQRLRLDSVIQGSTKIYPIFKELKRMDTSLKEVEQFLSLPQPRRLHEHLQEMTTLMEDLSQRLVELSADVHTQQANKVDTLVSRTDAIEARVESCLVDRERIGFLMEQVDIADTHFGSVRDIAQTLTDLWNLIISDEQNATTQKLLGGRCVVSRVKDVEAQLRTQDEETATLHHRIELLKDALVSYELQLEQQPPLPVSRPSRHSSSHRRTSHHRHHSKQQPPVDLTRDRSTSRSSCEENKHEDNDNDTVGQDEGDTDRTHSEHVAPPPQERMHVSEFETDQQQDTTNKTTNKTTTSSRVDRHRPPNTITTTTIKPSSSSTSTSVAPAVSTRKRPTVDFDAAISSLYASLEDVAMPVRVPVTSPLRHRMMGITSAAGDYASFASSASSPTSPRSPNSPSRNSSDVMMMSISEVDERLAALQQEKQRLRRLLISRV